jgi:DNA-binding HxlR family transcriptional regulator
MRKSGYTQFCPVAMACELLEPRWTLLILCEMWSGSTRFCEIQRGVPGMSPSLLSKRLREMERNGLLKRLGKSEPAGAGYATTPMADELEPLVHGLGAWAHRHVDPEPGLDRLDARVLLWNIRRKIEPLALPRKRCVVQFILKELAEPDLNAWLLMRPGADTDLCMIDPKAEVDLYIVADLKALTAAWIGHTTFSRELDAGRIQLIGDGYLVATLSKWLVRSSFASPAEPRFDLQPAH